MMVFALAGRAFRWVADALGLPRWAFAALLGMAVVVAVLSVRLRLERRARVDAELAQDSTAAAADSTRKVSDAALRVLGDAMTGVERRAVQARQERDAFDRALGRERVARVTAELRVADLEAKVEAPVTVDSGDVRRATFAVDSAPYSGSVAVALPAPPRPATLALRLGLAPARLDVRVGCGAPLRGALVRPATVAVAAPSWLTVALDTVTQAPEVCNAEVVSRKSGHRVGWLDAVLLGLGLIAGSQM